MKKCCNQNCLQDAMDKCVVVGCSCHAEKKEERCGCGGLYSEHGIGANRYCTPKPSPVQEKEQTPDFHAFVKGNGPIRCNVCRRDKLNPCHNFPEKERECTAFSNCGKCTSKNPCPSFSESWEEEWRKLCLDLATDGKHEENSVVYLPNIIGLGQSFIAAKIKQERASARKETLEEIWRGLINGCYGGNGMFFEAEKVKKLLKSLTPPTE